MKQQLRNIFGFLTGNPAPVAQTDVFARYSETDFGSMTMCHERATQLLVFKAKKSDLPKDVSSARGLYKIRMRSYSKERYINNESDATASKAAFEMQRPFERDLKIDGAEFYSWSSVCQILEDWNKVVVDEEIGIEMPKPIHDDFESFRRSDTSRKPRAKGENSFGGKILKSRLNRYERRPSV